MGNSRYNYSEWEHNLRTNPDLNWQGHLHLLDFPAKAKEIGFDAVDYVASIIFGHAEGISNQFIAVGEEGMIGDPDSKKRNQAIEINGWKQLSISVVIQFERMLTVQVLGKNKEPQTFSIKCSYQILFIR